jgi:hypothetical protein
VDPAVAVIAGLVGGVGAAVADGALVVPAVRLRAAVEEIGKRSRS